MKRSCAGNLIGDSAAGFFERLAIRISLSGNGCSRVGFARKKQSQIAPGLGACVALIVLAGSLGGCGSGPTRGAGSSAIGAGGLINATTNSRDWDAASLARTTYQVDPTTGEAKAVSSPADGSDEAVLAEARRLIAEDRAGAGLKVIDKWLSPRERSSNPLLPQAFLLRADATAAAGNEYEALYDYENVIRAFPGTPEYVTAVQRELEIGIKYLNGLKRKMSGLRVISAEATGEELLLRVHERLPGSALAERAGIELADYYYRTRDLESAAITYELFAQNHPRSAYLMRAKQREIFSNLGRFKGPEYDTTVLLNSRVLIDRFQTNYPGQAEQIGLDEGLVARIDESTALQLLGTAQWYLDRQDPVSARVVLQRLVRQHPQSGAAATALELLNQRGWQAMTNNAAPVTQASNPNPSLNPSADPSAVPAPVSAP